MTKLIYTGHVGFHIALALYGAGAIVDAGTSCTPALIRIPMEDVDAFVELVTEKIQEIKS